MRAVLAAAWFFEKCEDHDCQPDDAVAQLEEMAGILSSLSQDEREQLRDFAQREADRCSNPQIAGVAGYLLDSLLEG